MSAGEDVPYPRPPPADRMKALSRKLSKRGCITSPSVEKAFARIDRSKFLPKSSSEFAWEDAPLRAYDHEAECVVHLSAPSIYAAALEALDLSPSLSFLNVGSGAGYASALAATILGPGSIHHCVEISAPLVARCQKTFHDLADVVPELRHARVHVASCFDLDLERSMRFDRIYVGAGAKASDAKFLAKLLKPGGIIVGPFEHDNSADDDYDYSFAFVSQALLKATRIYSRDDDDDDEEAFTVEEVMPVQFAPLSRKALDADGKVREVDFVADEKDEKRQLLLLKGPTWGTDSPELFTPGFLDAIRTFKKVSVCERKSSTSSSLAAVPWHVWQHRILPLLAHDDVIHVSSAHLASDCEHISSSSSKDAADRRLCERRAAAAAAKRSLAIAKAAARWTLNRLTVSEPNASSSSSRSSPSPPEQFPPLPSGPSSELTL